MYNAHSSSPNIPFKIVFLLVLFHKTFRFRTQYYKSIKNYRPEKENETLCYQYIRMKYFCPMESKKQKVNPGERNLLKIKVCQRSDERTKGSKTCKFYPIASQCLPRPKIDLIRSFLLEFIPYICYRQNDNSWKNALLYSAYFCSCAF